MHWLEFLKTASRLAAGGTEGDWRSGISRSYYATFHCFRQFLVSNGMKVGTSGQSHFNVYAGLFNCGVPSVQNLARRLDVLRGERGTADYDLRNAIAQNSAQWLVQEAHNIVSEWQKLLTPTLTPTIVAGARQYLQSIGRLGKTP